MKRALRWLIALLVLAGLAGIVWRSLVARQAERASATAVPAPQALELAPADLATARFTEITRAVAVSGGLKAFDSAVVKAKVAAEVMQLGVREGDRVRAGQLIGRLDDSEFKLRLKQAEEQAASAEAQLAIAERTLANNQALVAQGFISRNALDTSVSNVDAARAALKAAQAASDLARKALRDTELRAPLAGVVAQRFAQVGERVAIDARVVEIVDLSRLELEAAVAPEGAPALRVGQPARLKVDGLDRPLSGRITRIAPSAQAGTRAVLAYIAVEPHPGLRQGLFAGGQVEVARTRALVVPATAVRFDRPEPYVLSVENDRAVVRSVRLGGRGEVAADGGPEPAIEIAQGLGEGAKVLRGSVGQMRDGTALKLPPAR